MKEGFSNNEIDTDEISLKEVKQKIGGWYVYLLSKWLMLLLFLVGGGLLGYGYSVIKKPYFTATTTFVLENGESSNGMGQVAGLASMVGLDIGGGGGGIFQGDNILELYKSKSMLKKTLLSEISIDGNKHLLIERYADFSGWKKKWDNDVRSANFKFTKNPVATNLRLQDSLLNEIIKEIKLKVLNVIKPDKKLNIIEVDVKTKDELFSKEFNNVLVENVNNFYVLTKTQKSQDNVDILQQTVDSVRTIMNGSIYRAAAVIDQTPNLNPVRQVRRTAPVQVQQFSAETNKAALTELLKNLEMSKISLRKEKPLIQIVDEPIYPLEKDYLKWYFGVIRGALLGLLACLIFSTYKWIKL